MRTIILRGHFYTNWPHSKKNFHFSRWWKKWLFFLEIIFFLSLSPFLSVFVSRYLSTYVSPLSLSFIPLAICFFLSSFPIFFLLFQTFPSQMSAWQVDKIIFLKSQIYCQLLPLLFTLLFPLLPEHCVFLNNKYIASNYLSYSYYYFQDF